MTGTDAIALAQHKLDEALKPLDEIDATPLSEINHKLDRITDAVAAAKAAPALPEGVTQITSETCRRLTVAALVGECEAIVASGALAESVELVLRHRIAAALAAHGMPQRSEFRILEAS
jgi:hypothetical protein